MLELQDIEQHGAPFRDLDLIEIGDELNLTFGPNTYTYIVDQLHVVPARGENIYFIIMVLTG